MLYWQKNRNYRKYPNGDGTFTYVIRVDGQNVKVSRKTYRAYAKADRRERYTHEREDGLLLSLERMGGSKIQSGYSTDCHTPSTEDIVFRKMLVEQMLNALEQLDADERRLIDQLYVEGVSARELARNSGIYHQRITYQRDKILEKLRRIIVG